MFMVTNSMFEVIQSANHLDHRRLVCSRNKISDHVDP